MTLMRHFIVNLALVVIVAVSIFMLEDGQHDAANSAGIAYAAPSSPLKGQLRTNAELAADSRWTGLINQLASGFQARDTNFKMTFTGKHEEIVARIKGLIQQALNRDDYTAYVLDSYTYKIRTVGRSSTITMIVKYRESSEQTAEVKARSNQVLAAIIKRGMGQEEKVLAIHDWIVRHVRYDESLTRYTAYDAITEGTAVCQGYALLAYRMLTDAGIDTRIIEGRAGHGEHAWNLVQLNGHWYHLDVTWDDPIPDRGDIVGHSYFLLSDAGIRKDHSWTRNYPAAPAAYFKAS